MGAMTRAGHSFAAATLVLVALMVACRQPAPECPRLHPPAGDTAAAPGERAPFGQIWVGTRINVDGIEQIDPQVTRPFFDVPGSYVVELWDVWPWASASLRTAYWSSEAEFEKDVRSQGGELPGVQAVLYDPEAWAATPLEEQQNPFAAMERFAALGHKLGLKVIITPGLTLPAAEAAVCPRREGESDVDAYLRCGIARDAGAVADVVEVQAQTLQGDPDAYLEFVKEAAQQARDANPDVAVLAGLRVRSEESVEDAERTWAAAVGTVDGHYLAMNPADAAELLGWITSCIASSG